MGVTDFAVLLYPVAAVGQSVKRRSTRTMQQQAPRGLGQSASQNRDKHLHAELGRSAGSQAKFLRVRSGAECMASSEVQLECLDLEESLVDVAVAV